VGGVLGVAFLISLAVIVFLLKKSRAHTGVTPGESANRTEPKEPDKTGEDTDIGGRLKGNSQPAINDAEVGGRLRYPDDNIAESGRIERV
jgi:hypothetical protein